MVLILCSFTSFLEAFLLVKHPVREFVNSMQRYGMIYVDKQDDGSGTMERRTKKSYEWYKRVISSCGVELD